MRKLYPYLVAVIVGIGMIWYVRSGRTDVAAVVNASTPVSSTTPSPVASTAPETDPTPASSVQTKTGQTVDTAYGPVQVQAVLTNGKLTDIRVLQIPQETPRDREIADFAAPELRQEALSAQSANIDIVSGATYTSTGYIQSLQSALHSKA